MTCLVLAIVGMVLAIVSLALWGVLNTAGLMSRSEERMKATATWRPWEPTTSPRVKMGVLDLSFVCTNCGGEVVLSRAMTTGDLPVSVPGVECGECGTSFTVEYRPNPAGGA